MARSPRALRYLKPEDMPPGMARLYQQREQKQNAQASARVAALAQPAVVMGVDRSKDGDLLSEATALVERGQMTITSVLHQKRNKYGAKVTYVDGIRFDSMREARYYQALRLRQAAGEIRYFLRQVPIHLPGGTKLVVDFMVVEADGRIRFVDAKGRQTPVFRLKKREVEHHYPVEIELA